MENEIMKFLYINGATALIEIDGFRLLTDPTFDPAGEEYHTNIYTLRKLSEPALSVDELGELDAVLLSHDHHFDNLDNKGRKFLLHAKKVITTEAGSKRLGGNAVGLPNWQSIELTSKNGALLKITGTPARHGPVNGDRGPVTGFILSLNKFPGHDVYISGDTVLYGGIEEINRRFNIRIAVLSMGAACIPEVGPDHLTFTAEEGVKAANIFKNATILPLHYEGWEHFSESKQQIKEAFIKAGLKERILFTNPGEPVIIL